VWNRHLSVHSYCFYCNDDPSKNKNTLFAWAGVAILAMDFSVFMAQLLLLLVAKQYDSSELAKPYFLGRVVVLPLFLSLTALVLSFRRERNLRTELGDPSWQLRP
jgi:hypothetical protein